MTLTRTIRTVAARIALTTVGFAFAAATPVPTPGQSDAVAVVKQMLQENQARLQKYEWIETTAVSLRGEEKSRKMNRCYYGADGKVQKVPISATPQAQAPGGIRGRIIERKKEELTDYMEQAAGLVHMYVPLNPQLLQKAKDAGGISIHLESAGTRLEIRNYLLPGDVVNLVVDRGSGRLSGLQVSTYLGTKDDPISLDVGFAALPDGTNHPATTTLNAPAKNVRVVVENSGYRRAA